MNYKVIIVCVVVVLVGLLFVYMSAFQNRPAQSDLSPFALANNLIQRVEKKQGFKNGPLDESLNHVAYGATLLRYIPERQTIEVALLVMHNGLYSSFGAEREEAFMQTLAGLSDPKIGGMFDTRGASWRFEKDTGKVFLSREFPLTTDAEVVSDALTSMGEVYPNWVANWMLTVAQIVHGIESAPTEPVTRENNPYKDRL